MNKIYCNNCKFYTNISTEIVNLKNGEGKRIYEDATDPRCAYHCFIGDDNYLKKYFKIFYNNLFNVDELIKVYYSKCKDVNLKNDCQAYKSK
jgi:hypothetical protein